MITIAEEKKKPLMKIIVSIIIVLVILAGFVFYINYESYSYKFRYFVEITMDGTGSYSVIVPFPDFDENQPYWSDVILNNLTSDSTAIYGTVITEYGVGLAIHSNESCVLSMFSNNDIPFMDLTMKNNSGYPSDYRIYANTTSANITARVSMSKYTYVHFFAGFRLHTEMGGPSMHISKVTLNDGWHLYEGYDSYILS